MRWWLTGIAISIVMGTTVMAADLRIQVTARPTTVAVGDALELRIAVSGPDLDGIPPLQMPELNYFKQGESKEETSYKASSGALQITRTRIVQLTAARSGTAKLKPIEVRYKGKTYKSNPVTIEVKGTTKAPAEETGLLIRSSVSATQVTVGEPIHYTLKVLRQFTFKEKPTVRLPVFEGFFQTIVPANTEVTKETIGGKVYYVSEIIRRTLYATEPGKIVIADAAMTYRTTPGGPQLTAEAPPVAVVVRPLPSPQPDDFKGAVGEFAVALKSHSVSGTQYAPVSIQIRVSGVGNLESVSELKIPENPQVKWIRGTATNEVVKNHIVARVLTYSVVPQSAGVIQLAPITLVAYSPKLHRYVTLTTSPIRLTVKAGDSGVTALDKSTRLPVSALRPFVIRKTPDVRGRDTWIWIAVALNVGALGFGFGVRIRQWYVERHRADFEWELATDRTLKRLDQLTRDPLATGVAAATYHGVHTCLSAKLRQSVEGLDATGLESVLRAAGATDALARMILQWRAVGESMAFSPGAQDANNVREFIQQSMRLVEATRELGKK